MGEGTGCDRLVVRGQGRARPAGGAVVVRLCRTAGPVGARPPQGGPPPRRAPRQLPAAPGDLHELQADPCAGATGGTASSAGRRRDRRCRSPQSRRWSRAPGHRRPAGAATLDRPQLAASSRRRAEHLRGQAVRALFALGAEVRDTEPRATPLADAVEALGLAASAVVRRFGWTGTSPWRIIAAISGGLLLALLPGG